MTDEQFKQLDGWIDGLNGAINKLAENVSPVDSSVHQAITKMSNNLAKWQAAQTEVIKEGFALVAAALKEGDSTKLDAIVEMLRPLGGVPANQQLQLDKLDLMHGLLADFVSADPEKIKEITNAVRSVKEKLKSSVDSQTKGD